MLNSIKVKVTLVIVVCLVICTLTLMLLLNRSYERNITLIASQSVKMSEEALNNLEKNDVKMLSSTLEALLGNEEIKKAYLKKDKDKLYKMTSPLFKNLKERYGITHWYFINPEPDQTCFLRVHKPEQSGDAIKRATYLKSVETKGFGAGKELGKTAFALRVVHPYYDGERLIGYMELGQEIDSFLHLMKKQTGNEYGLLIDKKFLDEKGWAEVRAAKGLKNNWSDMGNVVNISTTSEGNDKGLITYQGEIENLPEGGKVLEEINKDNSVFIRGVFPVYDAANRKVGGVFVLRDITHLHNDMQSTMYFAMFFIAGLMLVISVIIIMMLNKLVFSRLDSMIVKATRVVGGDFDTKIVPSSNDEVGKFEALFEQFRTIFVNTLDELESKDKK